MLTNQQIPLFELGLDMEPARQVKIRIMHAKLAENTYRNYRSCWSLFERWRRDAGGLESMPATPQLCIDHAAWCIAEGLRLETVNLRLRAINHYHRENNLPLPSDASVRQFMRNAARDLCERPQGKQAPTPLQLRKISGKLHRTNTTIDTRDRALIVLCFACGWRCSEIVSLAMRDVRWVKEGITLWLGKSKADQEGKGRSVGIQRGRRVLTCPLKALDEWLGIRGRRAGPLFTQLDGFQHVTRERVDSDAVRRAVKRGLVLIGEDPKTFGAHSLRAGMIMASLEAGASETAAMQRTGHRSFETMRRYVRPTLVFRANPLKGVL